MSECLVTLIVGVAAGETHFFLAATRILKQDPHDWAREEKVNAVDKNFRGRYGGCSTADSLYDSSRESVHKPLLFSEKQKRGFLATSLISFKKRKLKRLRILL